MNYLPNGYSENAPLTILHVCTVCCHTQHLLFIKYEFMAKIICSSSFVCRSVLAHWIQWFVYIFTGDKFANFVVHSQSVKLCTRKLLRYLKPTISPLSDRLSAKIPLKTWWEPVLFWYLRVAIAVLLYKWHSVWIQFNYTGDGPNVQDSWSWINF